MIIFLLLLRESSESERDLVLNEGSERELRAY